VSQRKKRPSLAPFGIRHEIAKRYTAVDWYKSNKVRKLINEDMADDFIAELIKSGSPGLVGRLGGTEGRFLGEYLKLKRYQTLGIPLKISSSFSPRWNRRKSEIFTQAGFYFDSWEEIEMFSTEYLSALSETDILGAWGVAFTWPEGMFLDSKSTRVIPVGHTAPWIKPYAKSKRPWSNSLDGKRVLVISGFAKSISRQHGVINKVFPDVNYPQFELLTVQAPLVMGQRDPSERSWFALLNSMKESISELEFDIALIAAGAFSFPLAAHVKRIGKIGIHCGGGLQIFFGVMGNRWNNSPEILKYVNEFWVRPSGDERPQTAEDVENACYW
jgi:hypothetical protein